MHVWRAAGHLGAVLVTGLSAASAETKVRPQARSVEAVVQLASTSVAQSLRPVQRFGAATVPSHPAPVAIAEENQRFQNWISGFKRRAQAKGISAQVLDQAFQGVHYDAAVIRRDQNQSEFTKTIWDYLDSAASATRISNGKAAARDHDAKLTQIETKYGVEKEVVVAIWGLESAYGSYRGSNNIIQSLATLAFDGRRGAFFEAQLIAALEILQNGDTTAQNMTGSWAGAMGHTQFIPTSYLDYAVDFTGDGRRDIWSDDPSDALASTAAYLANFGWITGQPWGVEVTLPTGFDYRLANRDITKSPADWAALGVVGTDGKAVPDYGRGSVLLPAGGQGAAFMIFKNFEVIERYNTADAYVIGVGHLSDRIGGGSEIQASWPRDDRALTFKERQEMQRLLTAQGFDTLGIDGKIGPKTIAAVRGFQVSKGLMPDGYPSLRLLTVLRP